MSNKTFTEQEKERRDAGRLLMASWTDQARHAISQGQSRNEFLMHCHPDNRKAAARGWRKAERAS